MKYFDTLEWQERLLHNSARVFSGMAYGKYCDKGRGIIAIELRRCHPQTSFTSILLLHLHLPASSL